jgi:hypothetical protein
MINEEFQIIHGNLQNICPIDFTEPQNLSLSTSEESEDAKFTISKTFVEAL